MVFVDIPGRIVVYDWSAFKVQIGDVVLDSTISLSCKRTNTRTVGNCEIFIADNYGDLYDSLDFLDEIEIYIQDPEDYYTPNKVWGGWLEDRKYAQGKMHQLKVTGKEYSSSLFDGYYTHNYSSDTDLGEICKDIVDDDGSLSSADIPSQTFKELQIEFDKERHWNALNTSTSSMGFEFGVSLEQTVYVRESGNAPPSPDEITLSENLIEVSQDSAGRNVVTDVTVQGKDSNITSNKVDSDVENTYGRKRELYQIMSDAGSQGTVEEAATTTLATQKNLINKYTVNTLFLPHTEPNDLIEVNIEGTELSSDYKVISIEHLIGKRGNITSQAVLNHAGLNDSDILSNLIKSYGKTEKKTWE